MKTRNRIEMARTRYKMRLQTCREIAHTVGWFSAIRAMTLGVA